jgi:hypothetical protein
MLFRRIVLSLFLVFLEAPHAAQVLAIGLLRLPHSGQSHIFGAPGISMMLSFYE